MQHVRTIKRLALAVGAGSVLVTGIVGSTFAATDTGTLTATVDTFISVSAPATLAFGAGVPGDTLSVLDTTVTVVSNNAAGYTLAIQTTNFAGAPAGAIPATALSFRNGVTAYAGIVALNTDLLLATTAAPTVAAGTDHLIDATLLLPYVAAGTYSATFILTASNI